MSDILAFVDDGFTENGYIAAMPGVHPELRFTYRPLMASERSAWSREMDRRPEDKALVTAEMLTRKLQTWELKDAVGNAVKIEVRLLLKFRPRLFDRLVAIVGGYDPSDFDPKTGVAAQPFNQEKAAGN